MPGAGGLKYTGGGGWVLTTTAEGPHPARNIKIAKRTGTIENGFFIKSF
jgi:hypothetical protein